MKLIILVLFLCCLYAFVLTVQKSKTVGVLAKIMKNLYAPAFLEQARQNVELLQKADDRLNGKSPADAINDFLVSKILKHLMWFNMAIAAFSTGMIIITVYFLPIGLYSFMITGAVISLCWSGLNFSVLFCADGKLMQLIINYITICEEPRFWNTDNPAEAREKFRPEAILKTATKMYPL